MSAGILCAARFFAARHDVGFIVPPGVRPVRGRHGNISQSRALYSPLRLVVASSMVAISLFRSREACGRESRCRTGGSSWVATEVWAQNSLDLAHGIRVPS